MKSPDKMQATEGEKTLRKHSAAMWTDYVETYRPAEAALIRKAELTKGERAQVKGEVAADTAAAFKGLQRNTISSGGQAGADISSGKTKMSLAGDADAAGEARGLGQAMAETGAEIDSEVQKVGIVQQGRGQQSNTLANVSAGAQRATGLALAASEARFSANQAKMQAIATVAGAATRKFGPGLVDKYKNSTLKEQTVTNKKRVTPAPSASWWDDSWKG